MTSKKIKNMLVYILVIIVAALVALPFIWMVVSAFKSQRELFAYPPTFFPTEWKWENFTEAASRGSISFWAMFLNSMTDCAVPEVHYLMLFFLPWPDMRLQDFDFREETRSSCVFWRR
ncbi:MAG: hypothetical protein ACLUUO_20310 [Sellimonas intestinalis]